MPVLPAEEGDLDGRPRRWIIVVAVMVPTIDLWYSQKEKSVFFFPVTDVGA